jgi:sugar lactone lactonase YvrE
MVLLFNFGLLASSLLALSTSAFGQPLAALDWPQSSAQQPTSSVSLIFEFQNSTFIENLIVLPDGKIIFTTFGSGLLRTIDPKVSRPSARILTSISDVTGFTGLAHLPNPDHYAVTGGKHTLFAFERGSMKVYIVSIASGRVVDTISVPDTTMMNGLVSIPSRKSILLSADSLAGRILRVDTFTRKVSVAFLDPELGPPPEGSGFQFGVNGIRIRDQYLYFTNSGRGTFGRVRIDDKGNKVGEVEIIARLSTPTSMSNAYDDFDFDREGNAYLSLHSSTVIKVSPSGQQTIFAGGPGTDACDPAVLLRDPTSLALNVDGKFIYISTGGNGNWGCDQVLGGQIFEVRLDC